MDKHSTFIELYNQLSDHLIDMAAKKNAAVKLHAQQLKKYGDFRNVIEQNNEFFDELSDGTLARFQTLAQKILSPSRFCPRFRRMCIVSRPRSRLAPHLAICAPEQIQAHPRPASDQYALGIVVYEWLSGQRPFQGSYTEIAIKHALTPPPPLRERVPHLPPAIEQVVMKALQKDPQQRFENVMTFAQTFAQVAQSATQSQRFPTFTQASTVSPPLPTSSSRPTQFMHTTLTPPNAPLTSSNSDRRPSSFTPPSQSSATPATSNTPAPLWPSSTVNPQTEHYRSWDRWSRGCWWRGCVAIYSTYNRQPAIKHLHAHR